MNIICAGCGEPSSRSDQPDFQCNCPLQESYKQTIQAIADGTVTDVNFQQLIEAVDKSVRERIARRTRPHKVGPKTKSIVGQTVPKRSGINNPPAQGRGKRYASGTLAKKQQNAHQRRNFQEETIRTVADFAVNPEKILDQSTITAILPEMKLLASRLLRDADFRSKFQNRYVEPGPTGTHELSEDRLYQLVTLS